MVPRHRTEIIREVCKIQLSCVSVFLRISSGHLSLQGGSATQKTNIIALVSIGTESISKNHEDVCTLWARSSQSWEETCLRLGSPRSTPRDKDSSVSGLFGRQIQEMPARAWGSGTGREDVDSALSRLLHHGQQQLSLTTGL